MPLFGTQDIINCKDRFRRNLINSLTGFKSVSLIGSKSTVGKSNLAIFSQIIHVGANPPLIGILFRPHTVVRHTLQNILETSFYTINHFTEKHYQDAHHTSARWQTSEFESCGFHEQYIEKFHAPFVRESPIKIGLVFEEKLDVQSNGTHLIIGRIEVLSVPDTALKTDGFLDLEGLGIVTCSGLDSYHLTTKLERLTYAKPNEKPKPI